MMGYPVDTLPAFDEDISLILTRSKAVECYDFFNAIANDTQASPNFEDGYEIELISDAILKSAQTHTWVDVH